MRGLLVGREWEVIPRRTQLGNAAFQLECASGQKGFPQQGFLRLVLSQTFTELLEDVEMVPSDIRTHPAMHKPHYPSQCIVSSESVCDI